MQALRSQARPGGRRRAAAVTARVYPDRKHGRALYQIGCRCQVCVAGNAAYMKDWRERQAHPEPVPLRTYKPNAFQAAQAERRQRERLAFGAAAGACLRCDLIGAGCPLCRFCEEEIAGRSIIAQDDELYCHYAADMFYSKHGLVAHPEGDPQKGLEPEVTDARLEVGRLQAARSYLTPEQRRAWAHNLEEWLEELNARMPLR